MQWKYGLIRVSINDSENDESFRLVELYQDENNNFTSFCNARIESVEELRAALHDVESDKINEYFYNNGTFTWDTCTTCYDSKLDWNPHKEKPLGTFSLKEDSDGDICLKLTPDILLQMGLTLSDEVDIDYNNGIFLMKKKTVKCQHEDDEYAIYGGD